MNYKSYQKLLKNADSIPEEIYIEMIKYDVSLFCAIKKKNQTEKLCIEAVKQNGHVLFYVRNQTEKICIEAVKKNGYCLQYVITQTPKICIEAVKTNKSILKYIIPEFQHLFKGK